MEACGRPLHQAPDGVDVHPVCLMHSHDDAKQSGPRFEAFWLEFHRTLYAAEGGTALFLAFVFPKMGDAMLGRRVGVPCSFYGATFTQDADFGEVLFEEEADFSHAIFNGIAGFCETHFAKRAYFAGAHFEQKAVFPIAIFDEGAVFTGAIFRASAFFAESRFTGETQFDAVTFAGMAELFDTTFSRIVDFSDADFEQEANFSRAMFEGCVDFSGVVHTQAAHFVKSRFRETAIWRRARFLDGAEFRQAIFGLEPSREPSAVFTLATFAQPSKVVFDDLDLSRVLFHNCDVSQVLFTSTVVWGRRDERKAVFDEMISTELHWLFKDGRRDFGAIAQIYQQLKKNYDARLDYWTADEFHFGEMEMKRLAAPTTGRLLNLRQGWR